MTDLESIADYGCTVGEGPLWHPDEAALYWLDIPTGHLYRYDPRTGEHGRVFEAERAIGVYTIQQDGSLLLFMSEGAIQRWRKGEGVVETIQERLPAEADSRFNDVVADPRGRVFAGTMPTEDRLGRLYRVDTDGTVTRVNEGFAIPNGIGFSLDRSTMYLSVSDDFVVYAYDYDQSTGELSNRRAFVDTAGEPGVPDGLTVDSANHVWCARWDDHALYRYTPAGELERRVEVPPPKASSLTFGGPEYADCYVTTAVGEGAAADDHPEAGTLYCFDPPVPGVPEFRSRIDG